MKREIVTTLSLTAITALSIAMMMPAASAQSQSDAMQAQAETNEMVSARVAVVSALDAGKAKSGDQFSTRLAKKVTLKDGKELPAGTKIIGVISKDEMQKNGTSELALTFNEAELKDGTTIPIKATIVGVYGAESEDMEGHPVAPGDQMTGTWAGHPEAVDEIGALPGIDMHSSVTDQDSGVLVSSSKHDFKLKYGTEIALAVAPAQGM
jgi:hypothetical protein